MLYISLQDYPRLWINKSLRFFAEGVRTKACMRISEEII